MQNAGATRPSLPRDGTQTRPIPWLAAHQPALRTTQGGFSALRLIAGLLALLVALPMLSLATSLLSGTSGDFKHLFETVLPELTLNSAMLALAVALGAGSAGTIPAWLMAHFEFPGRRALEWLLVLPLAVPAYVMAYAYTDFLQYAGPLQHLLRELFGWESRRDYWFPEIRSLWGAAVVLSLALYPYVYALARVAFLEQSSALIEAGRSAGLGRLQVLWRVAIPVARPAIAAGIALAVMETLADFGTVSYFGVQTFTTGIFKAWFSQGNLALAGQLALMLVGAALLCLAIEQQSRSRARYFQSATRSHKRAPILSAKRWLAFVACAMPFVLGFVVPIAMLVRLALREDAAFDSRFISLAGNSFLLAAVAAVLTVMCATALAYSARRSRSGPAATFNRLASTGYAIPGLVIAVGIMIPMTFFDRALSRVLESLTGNAVPLLLSGTAVFLLYAYLVRFLGIALQSAEAGLAKITPRMEDAARSLGADARGTLRRVHLPMLRGSLAMALLLVFVDVLKELPATLVMRPFNFDTLAVRAYTLAMDERLGEAALPALLIIAVALVPVLLASRALVGARSSS